MSVGPPQPAVRRSAAAPLSPVLQFVLLLSPVVMNGFFTVYVLTGWLLDGQDRFNWSIEAPRVAYWVGGGIVLYSLAVLAYGRWRGAGFRHPLLVSSVCHAALAVILLLGALWAARMPDPVSELQPPSQPPSHRQSQLPSIASTGNNSLRLSVSHDVVRL